MKQILLSLFALALFPLPSVANQSEVDAIAPCLREAMSMFRRPEVEAVAVASQFQTSDATYYRADLTAKGQQGTWQVVVKRYGDGCSYVGDNFVNEVGLYGTDELSHDQKVAWAKQETQTRVKEMGEAFMKNAISQYVQTGQALKYEIDAFEQLGLLAP